MNKVVIKFKNGEYINVEADTIELTINKSDIVVKNNGVIVAIAKIKEVVSCHLSERR